MEELKVGDVVYLKSGSPPLTITLLWANPRKGAYCTCSWITEDGPQEIDLPQACVERKEEEKNG